jgi:hypothetical protein
MSIKISLILSVVLSLFVTACSPTIASDPAPVSSMDQENTSFIPVTGENVPETSSDEDQSADDVSPPASNASMDEKQVQTHQCVLDGDLPRHLSGCVDWHNPDLNTEKDVSETACIPEDDLPHQRNECGG